MLWIRVVFSSDRSGYGNVYTVPVVEFDALPLVDQTPRQKLNSEVRS